MNMKEDLNDTIAAIATSPGECGIGIIRLSGDKAIEIADKIFVPSRAGKPSEFKTNTIHYGWISQGPSDGKNNRNNIIDEVLLTVMRKPGTYTRQDTVEINCHGGIVAMRAVLECALRNGCRLAEPGEFTKRAFLNGRIDLSQAEAVLDIIRAKTDAALDMGLLQLKGILSKRLNAIRKKMLECLCVLEANIDFPEEEIKEADLQDLKNDLLKLRNDLADLVEGSLQGRILREGINVVICGRPNVGKSSLLNALLKQERSIVTPVAGTTRDTIEEVIDIKGIPVKIIDTAGLLEPRDMIEKKAIARTKKYIDSADLVILVFDASKPLSPEDQLLTRRLKKKAVLAVINKIDLKQRLAKDKIRKMFGHTIEISAKTLKNIRALEDSIAEMVYKGKLAPSGSVMVANLRHIQAIKKAQKLVAETIDSLDNKLSPEFVSQGIKDSMACIDELLGRRFSEDLLDKIFGQFCIGK